MNPFNLDLVVHLLLATVLSWPFGGFLIASLSLLGIDASHPSVFVAACVYAAFLALAHILHKLLSPRTKKVVWDEEIVVITGGASGVGALLAETLSLRNTTVVTLDVRRSDALPENVEQYICDVSKRAEVNAVAEKIRKEVGHPTILVNNAAIARPQLVLDNTDEEIESTIAVNLTSHFWTIRAFLPNMLEQNHGHIVSISSLLGMTAAAQVAAYSASKSGVIALHESVRQEIRSRYKKLGVQTTLLCTGMIQTDLFAKCQIPMQFIMPNLDPLTVVKEIVHALDNGKSCEIHLPFYVRTAPLLRMVPVKLNDWIHEFTRSHESLLAYVRQAGKEASKTD